MLKIYTSNEGESAIHTDSKDEPHFIGDIAGALATLIESCYRMEILCFDHDEVLEIIGTAEPGEPVDVTNAIKIDHDLDVVFELLIPKIIDICCKYRGYKNGVREKRVLMVGHLSNYGVDADYDSEKTNINILDIANKFIDDKNGKVKGTTADKLMEMDFDKKGD